MPRTINYNELTNIIRNEYKNGACSSSSNKTTDKNIFDSMLEYSLFSNLMNGNSDYFKKIANDNFNDFFGTGESQRKKAIKEVNLNKLEERYPIIFSKSDYKNFGVDIRRS